MRPYTAADLDWRAEAACLRVDPEVFFPEGDSHKRIERAREVCLGCPVRDVCLAWAMETGQTHGIWGGRTPKERNNIRRQAHAVLTA